MSGNIKKVEKRTVTTPKGEKEKEKVEKVEKIEKVEEKVKEQHADEEVEDDDDEESTSHHGHSHGGKSKKTPISLKRKVINFTLLFLLVPLIYSLPFILKRAGEAVKDNRIFLVCIWSVYLVIIFGLIYMKKHLISISSFVNQNLIWLIFTLGVFIVLDIPKMIQQVELRTEVLYVWCTITMIPNLVIFFIDDTDYKLQEKEEKEKEDRKKKRDQERKARLDEKRKAKLNEKMKKYTPLQRKLINAGVYLLIIILVALLAWQTYRWYLRTQKNIEDRKTQTKSKDIFNRDFDIED